MGTAIADKSIISWKVIVLNLRLTLRLIKFNLDPNLTFCHSTMDFTKEKNKIYGTARTWDMLISAIHL